MLETCKKCGESKDKSEFPPRQAYFKRPRQCKCCLNKTALNVLNKWLLDHPEKTEEYNKKRNAAVRLRKSIDPEYAEQVKRKAAEYRDKNREESRRKQKEKTRERRLRLINIYGGKCECCGEDNWEFMALDHINGDGGKERKERGAYAYYDRLRNATEREPGLRLLCHNCNMSMGLYGYCPHQKK